MAAALQQADLDRISRMFVGLPHVGLVTFTIAGTSLTAEQELRCPVGSVDHLPASPASDTSCEPEVVLT